MSPMFSHEKGRIKTHPSPQHQELHGDGFARKAGGRDMESEYNNKQFLDEESARCGELNTARHVSPSDPLKVEIRGADTD